MKSWIVSCLAAILLLQGCGSTKYVGYKSGQIDPHTLSGVLEEDSVNVLLSNNETVRGAIITSTGEELTVQMSDSARKIPHRSIDKIVRERSNEGAAIGGTILGAVVGFIVVGVLVGQNASWDEGGTAVVAGGSFGMLIGGGVGAIAARGTSFLYSSALRDTLEVELNGITAEETTYFIGRKGVLDYRFARSEASLRREGSVIRVRGAREMFARLAVPLPP